ncbi:MAG TPA: dephospho-CoA kinase [Chthonomonadales bacterium]|nr:dephospho-CoA kinase [Chthonomonadales bacterium]
MRIGLTGGVATGKSAVADVWASLGARVLSADEAAREVTAPRSPELRGIAALFGEGVLREDGSLNRAVLAERVFGDPVARRELEQITHPRILALLRERMERALAEDPVAVVVVEAPLLYEAGMAGWFDTVVVVAAGRETQVARLWARDALERTRAEQRVDAQMPLGEKVARADHVVWNDGSREALERAANDLWELLTGALRRLV